MRYAVPTVQVLMSWKVQVLRQFGGNCDFISCQPSIAQGGRFRAMGDSQTAGHRSSEGLLDFHNLEKTQNKGLVVHCDQRPANRLSFSGELCKRGKVNEFQKTSTRDLQKSIPEYNVFDIDLFWVFHFW